MPASQDKPVSDAELERRLREGEVPAEDLPDIPPDAIVMEDQDPKQFQQMMSEGGQAEGMDPMQLLMHTVSQLPDRLAQRLGADE